MIMATINPLQHSINPLCTHLLTLGFDIFGKNTAAEDAFGIHNIDEDKLQNIAQCENKRLKRFAVEFPHEQHLLDLQSLLVSLLTKLSRHLNDQNTSVAEFHRELARIAVIMNEIDIELAKAKRRKDFAIHAEHRATLIEEELIRLAADNHKNTPSNSQKENRLEMQARLYAQQRAADREKEAAKRRELAEHAAFIQGKTLEAHRLLMQYRLHLAATRTIERFVEQIMRDRARLIVQNMLLDKKAKEEILNETLAQFRFAPTPK